MQKVVFRRKMKEKIPDSEKAQIVAQAKEKVEKELAAKRQKIQERFGLVRVKKPKSPPKEPENLCPNISLPEEVEEEPEELPQILNEEPVEVLRENVRTSKFEFDEILECYKDLETGEFFREIPQEAE